MKSQQKILSIIIPTFNEEKNLSFCLDSLKGLPCALYIVDSGSNDSTCRIARSYKATVYSHPFVNHAQQLNWALKNIPIKTPWVMRLDADERLPEELAQEIKLRLPSLPESTAGISLKRRVFFLGRWIRFGGYYPTWLTRIWRLGKGRFENRNMDEHLVLCGGDTVMFKSDIIDDNHKDLHWWIEKHNSYAAKEALDFLRPPIGKSVVANLAGGQNQKKRWYKNNLYYKLPLFLRPLLYFCYRYFLLLGFLDGRRGLIWHFLQGFWYRFLVDAKIFEAKRIWKK